MIDSRSYKNSFIPAGVTVLHGHIKLDAAVTNKSGDTAP
jgi:hypothetical protein